MSKEQMTNRIFKVRPSIPFGRNLCTGLLKQCLVVPETDSFDLLTDGIDLAVCSQVLIIADTGTSLEIGIRIKVGLQVKDQTSGTCDGHDVPTAKVGNTAAPLPVCTLSATTAS